jgi:hypothetical protein
VIATSSKRAVLGVLLNAGNNVHDRCKVLHSSLYSSFIAGLFASTCRQHPSVIMEAPSNPDDNESTKIISAVAIVTSIAVATVVPRLYVRVSMLHSFGWDVGIVVSIWGRVSYLHWMSGCSYRFDYGLRNRRSRTDGDTSQPWSWQASWGCTTRRLRVRDAYKFHQPANLPLWHLLCKAGRWRCPDPYSPKAIVQVLDTGGDGFYAHLYNRLFLREFHVIRSSSDLALTGSQKTVIFQCSNIRILWNPAVEATCWTPRTIKTLSYTNAALNIITDLLFSIAIPLPMLWTLHVNLRTRVTLMFILGIGVFACVAASIKVSYLTNYGKTNDLLWDSRNITIWTAAELNVAIIAASLPCLKPIFKKVLDDKYGLGSCQMSRKQNSRMRHQYFLSKFGRKSTGITSESQTNLKHGGCGYLAHVDSTNLTEIGSNVRSGSKDDVSSTVPDRKIVATTRTIVKFSKR